MVLLVDVILLLASAVLAVPTLVLALEVGASLAARRPRESEAQGGNARPRVGVVVPAHNEQAVLGRTLQTILPQLAAHDRLIVVADNCHDDTAAIARGAGALCIERQDRVQRGKGYAMDAGVRVLRENPPDVVIFTDADVEVKPGAIDALAWQVDRTGRPAQAEYLMEAPPNARSVDLVSRFAFTLKNKVRPLGLSRMGWPVPLFGAGMAFPWQAIESAPLASGDIVEDMRLGIDLCRRGQAPLFCPAAQFRGVLPGNAEDADTQRRRWEHGHLSVFRDVPALLVSGLRRRDGRTLAMAADHLVQPLTVLCAELLIVLLVAFFWRLGAGGSLSAAAAVVAGSSAILMAIALAVAWGAHMRRQIPLKALLGLPRYIVSRAGNQASWLFRREQDWVRTPRAEERPEPVSPAEGDGDALPPATSPLGGTSRPVPPPTTPTDIAPGEHSHLVGARE